MKKHASQHHSTVVGLSNLIGKIMRKTDVPLGRRLQAACTMLEGHVDLFDVLRPHVETVDLALRESRIICKYFWRVSGLSNKELNEHIRTAIREGSNFEDLFKLAPKQRKNTLFLRMLGGMTEFLEKRGLPDDTLEQVSEEDGDHSEDESAFAKRLRTLPAVERPLEKLCREFEQEGACLILFEEPRCRGRGAQQTLTRASVLAVDHLLLRKDVGLRALRLSSKMRSMELSWSGGNTSLGNALWDHFWIPSTEKAAKHVRDSNFGAALAELLGLLLYADAEDGWLTDQEVACEWKQFQHFFVKLSNVWKKVLGQGDKVLGLGLPRVGKPGGYRSRLSKLLENWELQTNKTLKEVFDDHREDKWSSRARLRIFTKADD